MEKGCILCHLSCTLKTDTQNRWNATVFACDRCKLLIRSPEEIKRHSKLPTYNFPAFNQIYFDTLLSNIAHNKTEIIGIRQHNPLQKSKKYKLFITDTKYMHSTFPSQNVHTIYIICSYVIKIILKSIDININGNLKKLAFRPNFSFSPMCHQIFKK